MGVTIYSSVHAISGPVAPGDDLRDLIVESVRDSREKFADAHQVDVDLVEPVVRAEVSLGQALVLFHFKYDPS